MLDALNGLPKNERADAIWLLSSLLGLSRSELLLDSRKILTPDQDRKWKMWWKRRKKGEPLQYVAGSAPFYGREFIVNRHVLIPRPETESLVELSLMLLRNHMGARVLDIGTGSGVVGITLKLERPDLAVVGSDFSGPAIRVARANASALGASVCIEKHDLFSSALAKRDWDLVVSNPPYLEFGRDYIAPDVKAWEPRLALEPSVPAGSTLDVTRAAYCAEKILGSCEMSTALYTALELSPRVADLLERRWRKRGSVKRIWREADLAGRKRFLLVSWDVARKQGHRSSSVL